MKTRRAWLWLVLLVLVGAGAVRLRFDTEVLNLLPEKLPVAQALKTYQQNFSDARELIITLEAPSAEEAEADAGALAQALRLQNNLIAEVTWQSAWRENPAQATELVAALWLNQPPAVFGELTNRLAVANLTNVLAEARERLATSLSPNEIAAGGYDPYGLLRLPESVSSAAPSIGSEDFFASRDGTFRLLYVAAKPDLTGYRACRQWLADIQRVIARARSAGNFPPTVQLHYTGRPAFVTEISGATENDLAGSAGGTLAAIGALFWLTHRRLRPMFWLLFFLMVILAGTAALGGLFLGTINVVSLGFASILLGLAEDFGIVIYQESRSHPELNAHELRREIAPGIFWSAVTTAGAFLTLNLSSLPGLGQLGSLVAIGIFLAAVGMVYAYLPPLLHLRRKRDLKPPGGATDEKFLLFATRTLLPARIVWGISLLLLLGSMAVLWQNGPRFDYSLKVLKPKNSEANDALEQIKTHFGHTQEPLWVLIPGRDETEVGRRLSRVNTTLNHALSNQLITSFTLPTALWPQPENQRFNRAAIATLLHERETLRSAAVSAGFTSDALVVTESILDHWTRAVQSTNVFWPTNPASRWILSKVVAHPRNGFLALGLIHPTTNAMASMKLAAEWPVELQRQGVIPSGWGLLGSTVFETVVREMPRVMIPIFLLVVVSLWLAFRRLKEVVLSLLTLAFSGLLLGAMMVVLHWDWDIFNLMALPLLLGMGVDFSIHIQLALRRYEGDLLQVRRSVGRALLLAGATTVAGFGSLGFSTNAGIASLGIVCALGITLALVTAVYLLPIWWKAWMKTAVVSADRETG